MAELPDRRKPANPRRNRLLAAIAASFAMISLACIPVATAHPGHERTSSSTATPPGVPAQATPKLTRLESPAAPAPATPAVKPPSHTKRAEAIVPATGAPGPSSGHHHHEAGKHGGESTATSVAPKKSAPAKGTEAGSSVEQRRLQERGGKVTSRVSRAKAKQVEGARTTALPGAGPRSANAPTPAVAPAAATNATAATAAATSTAATGASPSQPSASAPATAARPSRKASGHRHKRAAARGSSTAALPAASRFVGTVAPATGATASRASRTAPRPRRNTASPGIVAPLARTITRIVGVVPTAVEVLIGALLALALALAVRSRFAARRARRLERQRGQLLEDVGLLQAALLPVAPRRLGPVGTTAAYRPAAGPAAGGDFYDVFALEDGQLAVIVGDVSGHGREALPHTALVRFTLRAYLEAGLSPRGAVQTAGSVLERQLGGSFVTVVAATYNPRTRVLVYASAGHPPPIVLGGDAAALSPVTASSSPPIGVGMATGTRQSVVSVPGRAQICFHTDGVTEARIATELFGSRRLTDTLAELGPDGSAAELLDRVAEQVDRRPDDMAACLLSVEGDTRTPRTLREELEVDRETAASERTEQFLLACGLQLEEVPAVMHVVAAAAARAGSAVLEVHSEDGRARASLQHDNLAYLQTRHATRQADLRVSR
jgi:serine phosphatase RsbU (regulator of sigma subunit)